MGSEWATSSTKRHTRTGLSLSTKARVPQNSLCRSLDLFFDVLHRSIHLHLLLKTLVVMEDLRVLGLMHWILNQAFLQVLNLSHCLEMGSAAGALIGRCWARQTSNCNGRGCGVGWGGGFTEGSDQTPETHQAVLRRCPVPQISKNHLQEDQEEDHSVKTLF